MLDRKQIKALDRRWKFLREMRTRQEKRNACGIINQYQELKDEYGPAVKGAMPRAKRSPRLLPDAWDDYPVACTNNSYFLRYLRNR